MGEAQLSKMGGQAMLDNFWVVQDILGVFFSELLAKNEFTILLECL